MKLPKVIIEPTVWKNITAEVAKWAIRGKNLGASPLECVFYPLTAISLRKERPLTPFDTINLIDVEQFSVGSVFIPPEKYANYTSYSASFSCQNETENTMQEVFTKAIEQEIKLQPQLYFLCPGHSHPFAIGTTSPSSTDIEHHMRPYKRKNEELLGFRFSLALIIVQEPSQKDIVLQSIYNQYAWRACCFALDENEKVQNLGFAEIANNNQYFTPFYQSRQGNTWESLQKAFLADRLIEHERWPGGWTSFLIKDNPENATLVMLPPKFPSQQAIKQSISLVTKQAGQAEFWNCGRAYKNYNLGEVNNARYVRPR